MPRFYMRRHTKEIPESFLTSRTPFGMTGTLERRYMRRTRQRADISERARPEGDRYKIHSGGRSGAPTWVWLRSRSMDLSSSLMPRVKLGSLSR